jgi:hypothetical protein
VLGGIGLDLVPAIPIPAPDDEPHAGRGGAAERHRRAGLGFHLRRRRGKREPGLATGLFVRCDRLSPVTTMPTSRPDAREEIFKPLPPEEAAALRKYM